MPSSHLILCRPLLLLPPIPPSIRVFSNESTLHMRWPKYWSFSFSISPSNEHPGLISFRMDWLDLLAVQGTLKSLLQHHSSKASIFRHSASFTVQLSHPYMTTGKTIALTRWTFVGKVLSLLFNMLSRLVTSIYIFQMAFVVTGLSKNMQWSLMSFNLEESLFLYFYFSFSQLYTSSIYYILSHYLTSFPHAPMLPCYDSIFSYRLHFFPLKSQVVYYISF